MWYVRDVLYAVMYVRISCFVVRGCGVSRRYIDVCYCDMFSIVNVYLDHLKFCVVCINSRRYVCCSECDVVSNECNEPTSCLVQPIGAHCCEVMYSCFGFRGVLGFLNCDDVCMCVVNKQFELLEFVFESIYIDLQYDEIFLTFTAGPVCFKSLNGCAPEYLCDMLNVYMPNRSLRSTAFTSLVPCRNRSIRLGERLFGTSAAKLWNELPRNIPRADSITMFKQLLKFILSIRSMCI